MPNTRMLSCAMFKAEVTVTIQRGRLEARRIFTTFMVEAREASPVVYQYVAPSLGDGGEHLRSPFDQRMVSRRPP